MKKGCCKKTLSVIVPIYNVEKYVSKCLDSILNQSYKELEIVCVDDGSTDDSGIIADNYAFSDSRISVIHQNNYGLVAARKTGAKNCTGEYIINIDSDDWIEPNYIELFMNEIQDDIVDCVWSISYTKEFSEDNMKVVCSRYSEHSQLIKSVYGVYKEAKAVSHSLCGMVVKRELYCTVQMSIDDRISQQEDISFVTRLLAHSPNIKFIDNHGYHYYLRSNSMSHSDTYANQGSDEVLLMDTIDYLKNQAAKNSLLDKVLVNYTRVKMLHEYNNLQDYDKHTCLFPFPNITIGSRIIIFGAGPIGRNIIRCVFETKKCIVEGWVDTYKAGMIEENVTIKSPKEISKMNYDYIVVAISDGHMINEVVCDLENAGIDSNKIVHIDYEMMRKYAEDYYLMAKRLTPNGIG